MLAGELFEQLRDRHEKATALRDLAEIAEVCRGYDDLLNQAPDDIGLLFSSATAHMQLGQNGLAIALFQKCLGMQDLPEIWNNLGTAYKHENLNAQARECWDRALALREDADYYNNVCTLYVNEGNPSEGLGYAEKGLALKPNHERLRWNRSLLLLELGRWEEGFKEYEWGLKSVDRPDRFYSNPPEDVPYWDGTPGKTIVVYGEQGVGDEIMFSSAIPDLINVSKEVIFDCHPRMVDLFKRSFGITCYGTRKDNVLDWPKDHKFDYRIAIGSLFQHFRKDGKFPRKTYLVPDPVLVEHYRSKLRATGPGPYVGIGWRAGTKSTRDDLRSFKLAAFSKLIDMGGTFVSLQYTQESLGKVQRYQEETGRVVHHWPEVVETGPENSYPGYNYDHTVALIAALDLVICPNTSAVHVCGAVGTECWTITPDAPAWRYQLSGDEMVMYGPWVKQFRGGDAFERIGKEYRDRWSRAESAVA